MKTHTPPKLNPRMILAAAIALAAALLIQCQPFALRTLLDGATGKGLTITPSTLVIPIGQTVTFTASGGVSPYTFSVPQGSGIIDPGTGVYVAPGAPESDVVRVTDKTGKSAQAQITVQSSGVSVGISPAAVTAKINTEVQFTYFGGTGPYTFSKVSGGGSVTPAGLYTVPSNTGSATIRVTDIGTGAYADAAVTIDDTGLVLAVSPSSVTLTASYSMTFSAVGGLPPYHYAIPAPDTTWPAQIREPTSSRSLTLPPLPPTRRRHQSRWSALPQTWTTK
jgi:hypothetical protein